MTEEEACEHGRAAVAKEACACSRAAAAAVEEEASSSGVDGGGGDWQSRECAEVT
jgi:hypothetical protein